MKRIILSSAVFLSLLLIGKTGIAQISLIKDYQNNYSPVIGTFQGIQFREAGFSGLYPIPGTNGKEFWTITDRGVNIDAANANLSGCRPTYDKIYSFPNYAPKIMRIRVNGDSIQILQIISMKRPNGTNASGIINPTGLGSTALELASTDTVLDCSRFNLKLTAKDTWGIDAEGIVVDKEGNFWICEEGGPTIWKLNTNGVVLKRYTPYANLPGFQNIDVLIDTVFKYRKNNRGFEGIALAPNGKIYAMIQSPVLYPTKSIGEGTRIHRMLEIDPVTNANRMFAYLNDGIIGASGSNQIRLRDWKIGDMAAINDSTFLVLEAALRGTSDFKRMYLVNINGATAVHSGLYGGKTLEAWVDSTGLTANAIKPVRKTLFMDLLANGWPATLEKAEGVAIINDSTIAINNDNDYGQFSPAENGVATATAFKSHLLTYALKGSNKLSKYVAPTSNLNMGVTGPSTSSSPYLRALVPGGKFTSILTAGETVGAYKMTGIPDGAGALDNGNGTFTMFVNHEIPAGSSVERAHGQKGAFVSKWVINKSDLSVASGQDLIQNVYVWTPTGYVLANKANPNAKASFSRFCAGDLPELTAFYNPATGLGTTERLFMNGEESGAEGRAFGHILTGSNAGTSYELPLLGKFSWENSIASPAIGNKTIVIGTDDATPGQVYVYVGTKTNTGSEVDKAGLTNGKLYGVGVSGYTAETSGAIPAENTVFTMINMGDYKDSTGAVLNKNSNTKGVTNFLRPEDGAWDPSNLRDFYFVTTNSFTSPSRLWRLRFNDILNPEAGGTVAAVLDGTEGPKMMDNMGADNSGHLLIQEDVGGQTHLGKIWEYTIKTDQLTLLADHDPTRFVTGGSSYLTQDEESSGIFDAQAILGKGMHLLVDQAHYAMPSDVYEGGQFLAFYNPSSFNQNPEIAITGNSVNIADGNATISVTDNTDFGRVSATQFQNKTFAIKNSGTGDLVITNIVFGGANPADFTLATGLSFPVIVPVNSTLNLIVKFNPQGLGQRAATIVVQNTDIDESVFDFAIGGFGLASGITGPGTSQTPYLVPTAPGVTLTSVLTVGEAVGGYKLAGLGDGLGAFDNGNGTFTLLMHHEMINSVGAVHAHGQKGAFISKWVINKANLAPISGSDLIQNVYLWSNKAYKLANTANPDAKAAFNRFCAADLPEVTAFYNAKTGKGTMDRIFLGGEEAGAEGRAFAHIATGANAGTSYELPYLGKFSWENAIANPFEGDKTIVVGTDDATPGQVYIYVGNKSTTGTEVDKAGLNGGKLYGVAVSGLSAEVSGSVPAEGTAFSMLDLGNISDSTGAFLNTKSNTLGVTNFLRPEDGAWDPKNPRDFYFLTTNSFTSPSRMWRLRFNDIEKPEMGGSIAAVLDGTEGPKMMDNMVIDNFGHALIQEDPGNQSYIAKIWQYDIPTDKLTALAEHDQSRFLLGGVNYLTQDEESSGIIDMQSMLGPGMFLFVDQAHYALPGDLVEGGQILAMYNPATFQSNPEINISGNNNTIPNNANVPSVNTNTDFGTTLVGNAVDKTLVIKNEGFGPLTITGLGFTGNGAADYSVFGLPALPFKLNPGKSLNTTVRFEPKQAGTKNAQLVVSSNDFDESLFNISVKGEATNPITGTETLTSNGSGIAIYPNPANTSFVVQLTEGTTDLVTVKVYHLDGKLAMPAINHTDVLGSSKLVVKTGDLPQGIYIVEVVVGKATIKNKLIINH